VRLRLEFVAIDLGTGTTDSTGLDEGFVKVYVVNAGQEPWIRGDWNATKASARNCGASYRTAINGPRKFFPASVHNTAWFRTALVAGGMTAAQAADTSAATLERIMQKSTARCYLGGDPHLVAEERNGNNIVTGVPFTALQNQIGGDTSTFTATGARGRWLPYPGVIDPKVQARRPMDAAYLFPIYRGLNPGTKGVISVTGTVGMSGVLRGKVTLYATGNIVILDDQRYATDPSVSNPSLVNSCPDMLGIISANNIVVADNALNTPPDVASGGAAPAPYKNVDDMQDVYIHGVMMAINTSFGVQDYDQGPSAALGCQGVGNNGRGCLNLYGGLIQERRGAVGLLSGQGFIKRYTYDRCAVSSPPPYFPTTGRFLDNRYYEIDPVRFDIAALFAGLTPN
jgi:hypothetical protein